MKSIKELRGKNIKLFIGTPAFQAQTHVSYATSLAETRILLDKASIPCMIRIPTGGSLLCANRNEILTKFLNSDCTHILCIDADLGWSHDSVMEMLSFDLDFVCGLYPTRDGKEYLYRGEGIEREVDGKKYFKLEKHPKYSQLFKASYVPAGFMLIKRKVIEKMIEDHPEDKYTPKDGREGGHALFNTEVRDGEFWGEDFVFCRKARESGFDIWVYPFIRFCHNGVMGCFAEQMAQNVDSELMKKLDQNNL